MARGKQPGWGLVLALCLALLLSLVACGEKKAEEKKYSAPRGDEPARRYPEAPPKADAPAEMKPYGLANATSAPDRVTPYRAQPACPELRDIQTYADAARSAQRGSVAHHVPNPMAVGKTETITLLLSLKKTAAELQQALPPGGERGGKDNVETSCRMTAVLSAGTLRIDSPAEQSKIVDPAGDTAWEWRVTPQQAGVTPVEIQLKTYRRIAGETVSDERTVYSATVTVSAAPLPPIWKRALNWMTDVLNDYAKGVAGAALAAVGAGIWAWLRRKKK